MANFSQNQQIRYFINFRGQKNKFGIKTIEGYYRQIRHECEDYVLHSVNVTTFDKNLKNLDVVKAWNRSDLCQISQRQHFSNSY